MMALAGVMQPTTGKLQTDLLNANYFVAIPNVTLDNNSLNCLDNLTVLCISTTLAFTKDKAIYQGNEETGFLFLAGLAWHNIL